MENKITITVGASRKLNRQQYGGFPFESSDCWVSVAKDFTNDLSPAEVDAHTRLLQKTADDLLKDQVEKTILSMDLHEVKSSEAPF